MKIIAKSAGGFLLEADEYEVGRIAGFYSNTEAAKALSDGRGYELKIGQTIPVSAIYSRIGDLDRKRKEFANVQAQLRALADLMEPMRTVIDNATPEGGAS